MNGSSTIRLKLRKKQSLSKYSTDECLHIWGSGIYSDLYYIVPLHNNIQWQ